MKFFKIFFALFFMLNLASSQMIEFIPKERPIFLFGYCTWSPITCTVISTHSVYDTVKISAHYGALCIFDSVSHLYTYLLECTFVVKNPQKDLTYELWGLGITYPDQIFQIPFDTTYNYPMRYFNLKLLAKNGSTTVDSMLVLFYSDLRGDVEEFESNMNCALFQNYPNPFGEATHSGNPETSIEYLVPRREYITLKVYDILGREVAVLVDEVKEAGTYSLPFSAYHLPLSSG
ncbi:MAG: hypothetical protein FJ213_11610, partial [Ignavibacteria bacterium]|nr:hypothetical protein [Ignavibacteria bacterium]